MQNILKFKRIFKENVKYINILDVAKPLILEK